MPKSMITSTDAQCTHRMDIDCICFHTLPQQWLISSHV